jgi:hypothetical protein
MATEADNYYDPRFDEAEAEVDRGEPWLYREPDAPNPLTIEATSWSTGHTKLGEAEFLNGVDRAGKRWSVLVGGVVLTKRLVEGLVEEWDEEKQGFAVVDVLGRVKAGEVVSMKYKGDREGLQYTYPDFDVTRKPPLKAVPSGTDDEAAGSDLDDEFGF